MQLVNDGAGLSNTDACELLIGFTPAGFVDGRNAIRAADLALTGGVNQCEIWRGFAKRGLGYGA